MQRHPPWNLLLHAKLVGGLVDVGALDIALAVSLGYIGHQRSCLVICLCTFLEDQAEEPELNVADLRHMFL